jgi:hypothetical protein
MNLFFGPVRKKVVSHGRGIHRFSYNIHHGNNINDPKEPRRGVSSKDAGSGALDS